MTINKLGGSNYGSNKSERSDSASKSSGPGKSTESSKSAGKSGSGPSANVSLSGSKFESEISFAKNLLANSRKESFESLQKIKKNIKSGVYSSEAVRKEVSSFVEKDLVTLQNLLSTPSTEPAKESSTELTTERKEHLLKNPEVTKTVADKIASQLKGLA